MPIKKGQCFEILNLIAKINKIKIRIITIPYMCVHKLIVHHIAESIYYLG